MKIVINNCYGGFGLSHKAVMRYAELKGIKLYPYIDETFKRIYEIRANFDNPSVLVHYSTVPLEEKDERNAEHYFTDSDIERTDPMLIRVIEEMKGEANDRCAKMKIIEIPDDVDWTIEEYDGMEWVAEKHRTWE